MDTMRETIHRLMIALNIVDSVYGSDMTKLGVKESELWLMYALNDGKEHSQKQICEEWGFPKTTLNTAIKQAETAGYITLSPISGQRREMNICLTERGEAYAGRILAIVYQAEKQALEETLKRYPAEFVDAFAYFSVSLKAAFHQQLEERETNIDL